MATIIGLQASLDAANAEIDAKMATITGLEDDLADRDAIIIQLTAERDQAQDELATTQTNLAATLTQLGDAIDDFNASQAVLLQAENERDQALADLAPALEQIEELEAVIAELEAQLEEVGLPGPPVSNQGEGKGVPAQGKENKP